MNVLIFLSYVLEGVGFFLIFLTLAYLLASSPKDPDE